MGHPLIDEFCRIPGVGACQATYFNRVQRELRDQINPLLDEREVLAKRVEELEAELAQLKPRPVGRPRKVVEG